MKIPAMTILATMGVVAPAQADVDSKFSTVTAYVQRGFSDPAVNLSLAEATASGMLAKAGVRLKWQTGRPKPNHEIFPITVSITSKTSETFQPGALAYAQPFEVDHIRIFYDRVKAERPCYMVPLVLAHVLAHEITHILQGVDRHSRNGIMKAHWTRADIYNMAYRPLEFDPVDILLIHNGLASRATRYTNRLVVWR